MKSQDRAFKIKTELYSQGFDYRGAFNNENLPDCLAQMALDIARGYIDDIRIIPSDTIFEGEEWVPVVMPLHFVYFKKTDKYPRRREGKVFADNLLCRHKETGREERKEF